MAGSEISIIPEELQASANKVEEKTKEFNKAYTSIYTAVADLRVEYQGQSSDAFNQRIEGYRDDFTKAEATLGKYIQFLRDYAADMLKIEEERKSKAATLSIGK